MTRFRHKKKTPRSRLPMQFEIPHKIKCYVPERGNEDELLRDHPDCSLDHLARSAGIPPGMEHLKSLRKGN